MMFIIETPENTLFAEMPEELQQTIAKYSGNYTSKIIAGTQPVDGKELQLISANCTADELMELTNNDAFDEEGNQIAFDLGWNIVAVENEPINQALLLPYFSDVAVMGEDEEITYETVTDLTGKIQTWAGKQWVY